MRSYCCADPYVENGVRIAGETLEVEFIGAPNSQLHLEVLASDPSTGKDVPFMTVTCGC